MQASDIAPAARRGHGIRTESPWLTRERPCHSFEWIVFDVQMNVFGRGEANNGTQPDKRDDSSVTPRLR